VGGTWYWNRYPGARCDVESLEYSYSFSDALQNEWHWSERYAAQPEILSYIEHVADRFDLRARIKFSTRVESATFDAPTGNWIVESNRGDRVVARFCIMATGCLSLPRAPEFPGLDNFSGNVYHTGKWPHEGVDFSGRRVGVIGTGSSGIQLIPLVAEQASSLLVFQRTANFSIPAWNHAMDPEYERWFKENHRELREKMRRSAVGTLIDRSDIPALSLTPEQREQGFEALWQRGGAGFARGYSDLSTVMDANRCAADFVRNQIRRIVKDPGTAALLASQDYPLGAKRICVDTDYYATFNRPNVTLVDVRRSSIKSLTKTGICTEDREYALDDVVFATGYDALTGALLGMNICRSDGPSLRQRWADGPRTYLGMMTAGFPNLFMITGPGSPSVLSNMVLSIEHDVNWIAACIQHLQETGKSRIEATREAEDAWVGHVSELADKTLFTKAPSWYTGANIPGKPRIFMPYVGGVGAYAAKCKAVADAGYEGFVIA